MSPRCGGMILTSPVATYGLHAEQLCVFEFLSFALLKRAVPLVLLDMVAREYTVWVGWLTAYVGSWMQDCHTDVQILA